VAPTIKIGLVVKGPPEEVSAANFPNVMERANLRAGRSMGESFAKAVEKEVNKRIREQRIAEAKAIEKQEPPPKLTSLTEIGPVTHWRQGDYLAFGVRPKGTEELTPEQMAEAVESIQKKKPLFRSRAARELENIVRGEYLLNRKVKKVYVNNVWRVINEQLKRVTPIFVPQKKKGLIRRLIERILKVL